MDNGKKKKRFRLIDMNRDGKGVKKGEVNGPPTFKNFFKKLPRKFGKILSLNILMFGKIPFYLLVFILISWAMYGYGGIFQVGFATVAQLLGTPVFEATNMLYGTASGASYALGSFRNETLDVVGCNDGFLVSDASFVGTLTGSYESSISLPAYSTLFYIVLISLAVFSLITWGWQSCGSTYIARGLVRGDPVFTLSDYFHAVKKNLRQGLFMGIVDLLIMGLLLVDFIFLYTSSTGLFTEVLLFIISGMLILYFLMRKFIYIQLITFDIRVFKILKNSLIFTVLGVKRNLLGILGSIVLLVLNIILGILLMDLGIIVLLILPLIYYLGLSTYISVYSSYPVVEKYMITPYNKTEA